MASVGAAAFGLVLGWVAIVVASTADGRVHLGWREVGFISFSLLSSVAAAFAYVGRPGLIASAIGFGLGAVAGMRP